MLTSLPDHPTVNQWILITCRVGSAQSCQLLSAQIRRLDPAVSLKGRGAAVSFAVVALKPPGPGREFQEVLVCACCIRMVIMVNEC